MEFGIIIFALLLAIAYFAYGVCESRVVRKNLKQFFRNYHHSRVAKLVSGDNDEATNLIRSEMQLDKNLSYARAAKQVKTRLKSKT